MIITEMTSEMVLCLTIEMMPNITDNKLHTHAKIKGIAKDGQLKKVAHSVGGNSANIA